MAAAASDDGNSTAGLRNLLRCFSRAQLLAATLQGPALEAHHRAVLAGTEPFRNQPYHHYAGYSGPWIENAWVERLCCGPRDPALFGRFVPIFVQWVDLQVVQGGLPEDLLPTLHSLLRPDVLYVTVVQHADGVPLLADFPNVLILAAGGVGHVPVPLLKEEVEAATHRPAFGSERALLFFGNNVSSGTGPVRERLGEMLETFSAERSLPLPLLREFRGPRDEWLGEMSGARFVLVPRGHGRSSYALYEALQSGAIPVYVWSDLPWLPYGGLWDRGELGFSAQINSLPAVLSEVSLLEASEIERRRRSVLRRRELFTLRGVLTQILTFLSSDGRRGYLRCERSRPRRNDWGWRFLADWEFAEGLGAFLAEEGAHSVLDLGSGDGFLARSLAAEGGLVVFAADGDVRTPPAKRYHSGGSAVFSQLELTEPLPEDQLFYLGEFDWVVNLAVGEEVPLELEGPFLMNLLRAASRQGLVLAWGSCRSPGEWKVNCRQEADVITMFEGFGYVRDARATAFLRGHATLEWYKEVLVLRRPLPQAHVGPPRRNLHGHFTVTFRNGVSSACQSDSSGMKLYWLGGDIWTREFKPRRGQDLRGTWFDAHGRRVEIGCYAVFGPDGSLYPAAIMDRCHEPGYLSALGVGNASRAKRIARAA